MNINTTSCPNMPQVAQKRLLR